MTTNKELKQTIQEWQFASCPTEAQEPFFWKWTDEGLNLLTKYVEAELKNPKNLLEVLNELKNENNLDQKVKDACDLVAEKISERV